MYNSHALYVCVCVCVCFRIYSIVNNCLIFETIIIIINIYFLYNIHNYQSIDRSNQTENLNKLIHFMYELYSRMMSN
jgi:hypothetical protein